MNKFICSRCHLNTHIRTHFKRHLMRKNLCKPVYTDTPIKRIAESYGIDISTTENKLVSQNVSQTTYQSRPNTESQSITNCKYCNKSFTSANNCYRHQKHYCKHKKEITITKDEIEIKTLDETYPYEDIKSLKLFLYNNCANSKSYMVSISIDSNWVNG